MTKINNWQDYQGSSLKPEDFDKFWDEKINLVSNHQFEFELIEKNLSSKVVIFIIYGLQLLMELKFMLS
ncbi:hypothetical protein KF146HA_02284 [Lactococcus lactis]|nr:hypothetical protein [Lactococcus lactis]